MSDLRVVQMRDARRIPQVALQRYNALRSKNAGRLVCAFEGAEDVTFYEVAFRRVRDDLSHSALVCNGKDQVLGLRSLLRSNVAAANDPVAFFIDHDFDGFKGHADGADIYCTPTYSIENMCVDVDVLTSLLRAEFKCSDESADDDIRAITGIFEARKAEFLAAMEFPNRMLFYARRTRVKLAPVENDLRKYINVSLTQVRPVADAAEMLKLVGFSDAPDLLLVENEAIAFGELDPVNQWRGKFIYSFFRKILSEIKEDRGRRPPTHFAKRANVTFDPASDITRAIASMIKLPTCLISFIGALPRA